MQKVGLKVLDYVLVLVLTVLILLFVLRPFLIVFSEGLQNLSLVGLGAKVHQNLDLIRNSLVAAGLTTLLSTLISVAVVITMFYAGKWQKILLKALLTLSLISPPFVSSLSYINLFGRRGSITYHILGLSANPYGLSGIVLMQSFSFISLSTLILWSALSETDQSLIDSARSLSAKTSQVIRDVLLPQMRQAVFVVMVLSFIRSMADFSTPAIIGGRYKVLASEAYIAYIAQGNLERASFLNILLMLPALLALVVYMKSYRAMQAVSHGLSNKAEQAKGEGLVLNLFRILTIIFALWLGLQYASIIAQAFGRYSGGKFYFTLQNWQEAATHISGTFIRSIAYSLIAAVFCTLLGFLHAYYLNIRKFKWMNFLDWIAALPYIIPGTFFGIGYILSFRTAPLKLTGTAAIVILNMLFKQLPFACKMGSAAVAQIDPNLPRVVQDLGGHPLRSFTDVLLPQARDSLLLCFFRVFTSSMTTIGSIIFLVYPQRKLATLVLFDLIQSGRYQVASVIAVSIILICVAVNLSANFLLKRGKYVS